MPFNTGRKVYFFSLARLILMHNRVPADETICISNDSGLKFRAPFRQAEANLDTNDVLRSKYEETALGLLAIPVEDASLDVLSMLGTSIGSQIAEFEHIYLVNVAWPWVSCNRAKASFAEARRLRRTVFQ